MKKIIACVASCAKRGYGKCVVYRWSAYVTLVDCSWGNTVMSMGISAHIKIAMADFIKCFLGTIIVNTKYKRSKDEKIW